MGHISGRRLLFHSNFTAQRHVHTFSNWFSIVIVFHLFELFFEIGEFLKDLFDAVSVATMLVLMGLVEKFVRRGLVYFFERFVGRSDSVNSE